MIGSPRIRPVGAPLEAVAVLPLRLRPPGGPTGDPIAGPAVAPDARKGAGP